MADKAKLAEQLKKLTELRGPVPQELKDRVALQNKAQKAILDALKEGPKDVPTLAAATGMVAERTLWYLVGLKKYGKLEEVPGRGEYPKYALKAGEAK
ncbi:MAG TPA: hypothetical protein VMV90_00470 [Rectinemataceae bacterium]|nr:hypothetical protein [Rectinemataceae bacterium]